VKIGPLEAEKLEATRRRAAKDDRSTKRARPAIERIVLAVKALWPDGNLTGISANDRNDKINAWLKATAPFRPVSERAIRRALAQMKRA
jgi:hypothetical protein